MITEVATLTIDPTRADTFEAAVAKAEPLFLRAEGCLSFCLQRVIEDPASYRLVVGWTSVEAHMVSFRASPDFQRWRELVGEFFTSPPTVVHTDTVIGAA